MVVGEKILNLVEWHVVGVAGRAEGPADEVAGAVAGNDGLELRKVLRIELVVLDEVGGSLCVGVGAEHADDLLLERRLVVDHEFGGRDALAVHQVQD